MTLDVSMLTRYERSSLSLALEMTADFLGIEKPDFAAPIVLGPSSDADGAAPSADGTASSERALVIPSDIWERPAVQKLREEVARKLYADDLRADLVDRAVFAVVSKLTTRHDLNRLVHVAVQSARENERKKQEPTRAWLLFYPALKSLFESNGIGFPKMTPRLEPEPAVLARKREEDERVAQQLVATTTDD